MPGIFAEENVGSGGLLTRSEEELPAACGTPHSSATSKLFRMEGPGQARLVLTNRFVGHFGQQIR